MERCRRIRRARLHRRDRGKARLARFIWPDIASSATATDGILIDTHSTAVCDDVWTLYRYAMKRVGRAAHPDRVGPWTCRQLPVLLAEAARAQAILSMIRRRTAMLHDLQRAFRAAVLGTRSTVRLPPMDRRAARRASARIDVYRNTVQASLIEVLAVAFPVVRTHRRRRRSSRGSRGAFIASAAAARSRSSVSLRRGFRGVHRRPTRAIGLPYLADVARLEWARGESYFAADAPLPRSRTRPDRRRRTRWRSAVRAPSGDAHRPVAVSHHDGLVRQSTG